MTTKMERPRIPTLNELVGSQQVPEDVGGAWIVYAPAGHVTCVTDNRDAAETAIYCKAEESGLDWVGRGYGSRERGAEQLNISEWEFSETYGEQLDTMRFLP